MQIYEPEHPSTAAAVQARYQRSRHASQEAFELWSAAQDVETERFTTLDRIRTCDGDHTTTYKEAEQAWLDACRVRSGLMLRWAALDWVTTARFADYVQLPDVQLR